MKSDAASALSHPVSSRGLVWASDSHCQFVALFQKERQLWNLALLAIALLALLCGVLLQPGVGLSFGFPDGSGSYRRIALGVLAVAFIGSLYMARQRRTLEKIREILLPQLLEANRSNALELIDPLTSLFNRRAIEQLLPKEISRANRLGSKLTIAFLELHAFRSLASRCGEAAANQCVIDVADRLRETFRGSDLLFRHDDAQFLVVLPDTNSDQAEHAMRRFQTALDRWNVEQMDSELALLWALGSHAAGLSASELLHSTLQRLHLKKQLASHGKIEESNYIFGAQGA